MTYSTGTGRGTQGETRPPYRMMVWSLLRSLGSIAALIAIYYLLPLDHTSTLIAVATLVIGLVALVVLVGFQVRWIIGSPFPGLRAIEALGTSVPLFLLLFASTYLVMASISGGSFNQPLTHTDSLYFSVTVFATVGFGDIVAKTEAARLVVTLQMVADLVIIGIGARIILGAITTSRRRRPEGAGAGQPSE